MNWLDKIYKETCTVPKTARCFFYGNDTISTRHAWLVFHGYGQLATGVIRPFTALDENKHYVIAPEGLSRFYVEGVAGKVGASWMTKEDRELEFADQFTFLDRMAENYIKPLQGREIKLHLLGFSQGVATLTRWLARYPLLPDTVIFWAGSVPVEDVPKGISPFSKTRIHCLAGNRDEYVRERDFDEMVKKIESKTGNNVQVTKYEGLHKVDEKVLMDLVKLLD